MNLITWVVALCNRNWQRKLDAMITEVESEEKTESIADDIELLHTVDQPTHLSHKFKARAKRKNSKPAPKGGKRVDK